jgi:ribonuclease BN (tRNA processing enzyme)
MPALAPDRFQVLVLGVGDTFSARHVTSALLLSQGGVHLAVDCPDRYRGALAAAAARAGLARPIDVPQIDTVLLTHVHGDHMNGLEGVAFFKRFVELRRLRLVISPELHEVIWSQRLVATMGRLWDGTGFVDLGFSDYFDYQPLSWDGDTVVGPFRIRARRTRHHVPTSALLVSAAGRTLGYSADTAFDPELIDFLSEADLIIHETNHGPAHTPYESLAALPAALRARMRLIHYSDTFDSAASVIEPLTEGALLEV